MQIKSRSNILTSGSFFIFYGKFLQKVIWLQFSNFAPVDLGNIYWFQTFLHTVSSTENVLFVRITNSSDKKETSFQWKSIKESKEGNTNDSNFNALLSLLRLNLSDFK